MLYKKGAAMIWLVLLLSIFIIGIIWVAMDKPFTMIKDKLTPGMSSEHQETANKIDSAWRNWPLFFVLGMVVWAVIATVRERSRTPGYM